MGKSQRAKGQRLEREVTKLLAPVFPGLERQLQSRQGAKMPDLDAGTAAPPCPVRIEVSGGQRPSPHRKFEQCTKDAMEANDPRPPLVLTRKDRGEWLVTMSLLDWLDLWKLAHGGDDDE
jgi:hypothetical protein